MQLITPAGRRHEVSFAYGPTMEGSFVFELLEEERPLWEVAREFDGMAGILTVDDVLGDRTFEGFCCLCGVQRIGPKTVDVTLERGEKA